MLNSLLEKSKEKKSKGKGWAEIVEIIEEAIQAIEDAKEKSAINET
jgi:hypothetical protein